MTEFAVCFEAGTHEDQDFIFGIDETAKQNKKAPNRTHRTFTYHIKTKENHVA